MKMDNHFMHYFCGHIGSKLFLKMIKYINTWGFSFDEHELSGNNC